MLNLNKLRRCLAASLSLLSVRGLLCGPRFPLQLSLPPGKSRRGDLVLSTIVSLGQATL